MKALVYEKYGPPEKVLELREVPKPFPKENEILIKIHATAINDYDWSMLTGKPYVYRLMYGLLKPKYPTPGMELAGTVEAIGANVKTLKTGDAVFGDISNHGFGTFAEFICIDENAVIKKPAAISFEEAAAIPHAATLALQALQDIGQIKQGQKVLINGGGGGVGTLGLQIAKLHNCDVTGVDAKDKLEMMRELGFDQVIDYKTTNFTKTGQQYDLVLDCKTNQSTAAYKRALNPKGTYVSIGGKLSKLISLLLWGKILTINSNKNLKILALKPNKDLREIAELIQQQKLKCQIEGPYSLAETARLIQHFGEGKHKGKVVIINS